MESANPSAASIPFDWRSATLALGSAALTSAAVYSSVRAASWQTRDSVVLAAQLLLAAYAFLINRRWEGLDRSLEVEQKKSLIAREAVSQLESQFDIPATKRAAEVVQSILTTARAEAANRLLEAEAVSREIRRREKELEHHHETEKRVIEREYGVTQPPAEVSKNSTNPSTVNDEAYDPVTWQKALGIKESLETHHKISFAIRLGTVPTQDLRPTQGHVTSQELHDRVRDIRAGKLGLVLVVEQDPRPLLVDGHDVAIAAQDEGLRSLPGYILTPERPITCGLARTADALKLHTLRDVTIKILN